MLRMNHIYFKYMLHTFNRESSLNLNSHILKKLTFRDILRNHWTSHLIEKGSLYLQTHNCNFNIGLAIYFLRLRNKLLSVKREGSCREKNQILSYTKPKCRLSFQFISCLYVFFSLYGESVENKKGGRFPILNLTSALIL